MPSHSPHIAVIGGGITGLAAAHRVMELAGAAEVKLFEAGEQPGGVLMSEKRDGFLIERAADMFITKPSYALDLCRRIGLEEELIGTNSDRRKVYVVQRGKLVPVPVGFQLMAPTQLRAIATTPLLSLRGKLRMAAEPFVPRRKENGDESLADFVRRRLGREAFDRLVQPMVGGIYTADPEKLSMQAALARFVQMEREHGSLIRGLRRQQKQQPGEATGARYELFMAPRDGMARLPQVLVTKLPENCLQLGTPVLRIERQDDGRFKLTLGGRQEGAEATFDGVIIAAPAYQAAKLLAEQDAELADELAGIHYAGAAIAVVAYDQQQVAHPLDGFGCVVPEVEGRRVLAISFSHNKFAGRAPDGKVLLRVFVGGALHPELLELADDELRRLVQEELADLLGVRGEPLFCELVRWRQRMPQYHLGHAARVARIEEHAARLPGLELAGNAFRGVGIPDCIHSGESAAARLLAAVQTTR